MEVAQRLLVAVAALLWVACFEGTVVVMAVDAFPRATVFSKLEPIGAPGKISGYGNTLSLLLLPPHAPRS